MHPGIFNYELRIKKAQAMLVAILMITAAALAIGLAVTTATSTQVKISLAQKESGKAYFIAQTCLENTLMRFSRANFAVPPSFTLPDGSCTIIIEGSEPYEITSTGQVGKTYRKIRATVSVNNEVLSIQSLGESY